MPRYMRDAATNSGSTSATAQATRRSARLGIAELSSRTSPTYTAIDAAVWPDG